MHPELLLGPLVRGARPDQLSLWLETDRPCIVEVLGCSAPSFQVAGHHYCLVDLPPLQREAVTSYEVCLDGRRVWPEPGTTDDERPGIHAGPPGTLRIMAGSCRQQAPEPLWLRRRRVGFGDLGPDALATLASDVRAGRQPRPDLLLLTGDQVYADEQHRSVRDGLRQRRGGLPAAGRPEVTTYDEYAWLYQQTWSHPLIRWLLASVPSLMIFDDHDVIDDWNISDRWMAEMAGVSWWPDRIRAALMSYWVYQHLGNLSPADRADDETVQAVLAAGDGADVLAGMADRLAAGRTDRLQRTWSYGHRTDLVDVVVLDSRNARVLEPAERSMLAPADWDLLETCVRGADERHLLVVTSVPWALPVGIHRLQQWISHLADGGVAGRAGPLARRAGEAIRRSVDLEHWPAFGSSYERLRDLLGPATARTSSTVVLSGDVHFAYVATVAVNEGPPIHQVVASPLRQVELSYERAARRVTMSGLGRRLLDCIARRSSARTAPVDVELCDGPVFDNNIASLTYRSNELVIGLERAVVDRSGFPRLRRAAGRLVGNRSVSSEARR